MVNKIPDKTEEKQKKGIGKKLFKKGQSGNPDGRPKGSAYMEDFKEAIKIVEKEKKQKFFERVMQRAWTSDTVMVAVLKKFIPDTMRQEIEGLENVQIIIKRAYEKQ